MTRLEARLNSLAAAGNTIRYGILARDLGMRMAELTAALEALMEQDATANRPFRAALCEGRLNNGLPAPGFFEKAATLGCTIEDRATFIADQRQALQLSKTVKG